MSPVYCKYLRLSGHAQILTESTVLVEETQPSQTMEPNKLVA
jgi:hypothetical protein